MDESVSTVVDPVGEETGELSSDDSSSLCNHCSESNSGFRIGFKHHLMPFGESKNPANRNSKITRGRSPSWGIVVFNWY
jgi:hypothetical protein